MVSGFRRAFVLKAEEAGGLFLRFGASKGHPPDPRSGIRPTAPSPLASGIHPFGWSPRLKDPSTAILDWTPSCLRRLPRAPRPVHTLHTPSPSPRLAAAWADFGFLPHRGAESSAHRTSLGPPHSPSSAPPPVCFSLMCRMSVPVSKPAAAPSAFPPFHLPQHCNHPHMTTTTLSSFPRLFVNRSSDTALPSYAKALPPLTADGPLPALFPLVAFPCRAPLYQY